MLWAYGKVTADSKDPLDQSQLAGKEGLQTSSETSSYPRSDGGRHLTARLGAHVQEVVLTLVDRMRTAVTTSTSPEESNPQPLLDPASPQSCAMAMWALAALGHRDEVRAI